MKKIIFTLTACILTTLALYADHDCPYCKGTGKIVKNISTSRFGHDYEAKVRCKECGVEYLPSTGHTHIHCKYCGGRGKIADSYSANSSSYGDAGYVEGVPSVLDLDYNVMTMQAQLDVRTQYYGFPISSNEQALLDKLTPTQLNAYSQLRAVINSAEIYANEAIQKNWARNMTMQEVQNTFNTLNSQSNTISEQNTAIFQTIPAEILTPLFNILTAYSNQVNTSFSTLAQLVQVAQVANQLDNLRLMY